MNKKATIRDVAAMAGVSVSAVSYIMNNSTAKKYSAETVSRVKEAAGILHYSPTNIARGMRSQKAHAIGIVSFWNMSNRVFVHTLEGIMAASSRAGYAAVLCPVRLCPIGGVMPDDFGYIDYFTDKRVDGIILIAPPTSERIIDETAHIAALRAGGVPFVIINSVSGGANFDRIDFNYFHTTFLAAQTLLAAGHESIAYISPAAAAGSYEAEQRLEGYLAAVSEPKVLMLEKITPQILTGLGAVVTNKSDTARALLNMAIDHGIDIPGRLSVIAANVEHYSEYLHPPLTCVQMPFSEIGELSVEMLLARIDGNGEPRRATLPCEIFMGRSARL